MPTEVYDLSPQQLDWLYEHQALINGGAESPSFPMMTTPPSPVPRLIPDVTKNNYILVDVHRRDSLTHGGGSDASTANSTSHNSDGIDSHLTDAEIIMFPFHLDRPSWEQSLTNMMCFKERNGHCNVPRFYPAFRQLGSWVHRQRLKKRFPHKYGALSKEQVQKLDSVGFHWRVRKEGRC